MTAVEHMIAWIESSGPHYARLCRLEQERKGPFANEPAFQAASALTIITSAFREATRGGDMFAEQWTAAEILDAAKALLSWEMEQ